jgi:hypothetical protein
MRSFAVISISILRSIPTGYISRRIVGRLLGIWCRNRCCRFNFGICPNIDTNAKCLLNEGGEQKNQNFII